MDMANTPVGHYAFLNHSPSTLPHNLPPNVDDRPLARQKRKRTSPEDQATLEAAYQKDPKPDKAARLELVKHVGLGEKEVQIWFQNRRQSSRRKSRPLLPHEVAQYQMSRFGPYSLDTPTDQPAGLGKNEETTRGNDGIVRERDAYQTPSVHAADLISTQQTPVYAAPNGLDGGQAAAQPHQDGPAGHNEGSAYMPDSARAPVYNSAPSTTHAVSALPAPVAHRRSSPSLQMTQQQQDGDFSAPSAARAGSAGLLRKSSSYVRLSMSSDGNASVVTKDGTSPSPPRASQINLQLSNSIRPFSASTGQPDQAESIPARSNLHRTSSGRSRDSRAWEFWCDKDARSELEEKAEQDSSGSAADAIGLLRSASGRSILGAIPAKRNSLLPRPSMDLKRSKLGHKRPSLQRSNTSFGRLQGKSDDTNVEYRKTKSKLKHSESAVSVYIPGNESDKENWSPESDRPHTSHSGPYAFASRRPSMTKPVLGESRNAGNGDVGRRHSRESFRDRVKGKLDSENADPEADAEVAAFMKGGRTSASMSSEDDLDCVQGLLSLSQGNWR